MKIKQWLYKIWRKLFPVPAPATPYVSRYSLRSAYQHQEIRLAIQYDPKTCQHLKGGRYVRSVGVDYNVLTHTFPNGKTRIRCGNCSRVWWSTDPDWQDALKMVNQSTNCPSASEVRLKVSLDPDSPRVVYQDKLD